MTALRELVRSRELLVNLTLRELRGRYKRTALGHGWSLINPIVQLAIFSLVFGVLLRAAPPQGDPSGLDVFVLWLAAGFLPWVFFSTALTAGSQSLLTNAEVVKKVYFPRELVVGAAVLSALVTFGVELAVLVAALLVVGANPLPWLPAVVLLVAVLLAFALGLALLAALCNVYFRDTTQIITIVLQLAFYLTPIVYPRSLVEAASDRHGGWQIAGRELHLAQLYELNSLVSFVDCFRALLYDNHLPDLYDAVYASATAGLVLTIGALLFARHAGRLAEEL